MGNGQLRNRGFNGEISKPLCDEYKFDQSVKVKPQRTQRLKV